MNTYKITVWWEAALGWDSTEFGRNFVDVYRMQTACEKIAAVGVWDQDEVGRDVLIPPSQIRRIVVETVDE